MKHTLPGWRTQFASDNTAGICPEALDALQAANEGWLASYGNDALTREVCDRLRELFETECDVYFVFNGTAANSLALATMCQSYHSVICTDAAHIETDECGAPEFFSNGTKLLTAPHRDGKLQVEDVRLLAMVSVNDHVVGEKLGRLIFETATATAQRNLIIQYPDAYGDPAIGAGHNESYALDADFDAGIHNLSYRRAIGVAKLDAIDYYGYWKLLDALMDCVRQGENCEVAFGNTEAQRNMGCWSDGKKVRELEVVVPGEQMAE